MGCSQDNRGPMMDSKGEIIEGTTYGIGRFLIDVPAYMEFKGDAYSMRNRSLVEVVWPDNDLEKSVELEWDLHLKEIEKIEPPKGVESVIIESRRVSDVGMKWGKSVYYLGYKKRPNRGYLDLLIGTRTTGLWIKSFGKISGKRFMYDKSFELAKAYRPPSQRLGKAVVIKGKDSFYLRYGAIDLPFEYKEGAHIWFKGHPLDMELEFSAETRSIDKEKQVGLLRRADAVVNSDYAPGVKIENLRAKERTLAGLKGEELIQLGSENKERILMFTWMYLGEVRSGDHPYILITMTSKESDTEEKIALWDRILDSFRVAGR